MPFACRHRSAKRPTRALARARVRHFWLRRRRGCAVQIHALNSQISASIVVQTRLTIVLRSSLFSGCVARLHPRVARSARRARHSAAASFHVAIRTRPRAPTSATSATSAMSAMIARSRRSATSADFGAAPLSKRTIWCVLICAASERAHAICCRSTITVVTIMLFFVVERGQSVSRKHAAAAANFRRRPPTLGCCCASFSERAHFDQQSPPPFVGIVHSRRARARLHAKSGSKRALAVAQKRRPSESSAAAATAAAMIVVVVVVIVGQRARARQWPILALAFCIRVAERSCFICNLPHASRTPTAVWRLMCVGKRAKREKTAAAA